MPRVDVEEICIKSVKITLTVSEAKDLENILYNKLDEYDLSDSDRVTSLRIREQLSEVLEDIEEEN